MINILYDTFQPGVNLIYSKNHLIISSV